MQNSLRNVEEETTNKQNSLRNIENKTTNEQNSLRDTVENAHSQNSLNPDLGKKRTKKTEKPKEKTKDNKRTTVICVTVVLLLLLVGGLGWYSTTRTVVPDVNGMTAEGATKKLKEAELKTKVEYRAVKESVDELVTAQDIEAPKKVKKGTTITVTVVKEAEYLVVENYSNEKYGSVKAELDKKNIMTRETQAYDDSIKKGRIIKQDVKKGDKVYEGETIAFTVSKGHEKTTVPNVVGKDEYSAKKAVKAAKLKVRVISEYSDSVSKGKVIRQGMDAGKSVNTKEQLTIVISDGKRPTVQRSNTNSSSKPSRTYNKKTTTKKKSTTKKKTKKVKDVWHIS